MQHRIPRATLLCGLTALLAMLAGCGGGSASSTSGSSSSSGGTTVANSVPITVDSGVAGGGQPNTIYTMDHVQVDTGSYGFRVLSEALTVTGLTPATDSAGNNILECTVFADGYSWGPVTTVDLKVAGLTATSVPIQIIGSPSYTTVPSSCSTSQTDGSALTQEDTVSAFGANAILGIGVFVQDCGTYCADATQTQVQNYYSCTAAQACTATTLDLNKQVQNPVPLFSTNNNGIAIQLPALSSPGAATASGTLFFGVATETDNALTANALYAVYGSTSTTGQPGTFITTYAGSSETGFIDSGSNGLFFTDGTIPTCVQYAGFFCPSGSDNLSATIQGVNTGANSVTVNFTIDNAATLFGYNYFALPTLGGSAGGTSLSGSFDWGVPFFYGRTVFYAIENATVSGSSTGPWVGF